MTNFFIRRQKLMGSAFEFQISAHNQKTGEHLLDQCALEVKRLEDLLSEFSPTSITSKINIMAGGDWTEVPDEFFKLLERSLKISQMTQGAFDISGVALRGLYNFKGEKFEFPAKNSIRKRLQLIGHQKIEMKAPNFVRLAKKGMRIGFGAIGKGFAADVVKSKMVNLGVESGAINASGDLSVWGTGPNGENWKIGIANPDQTDKMMLWLPLKNNSIATSGDYEQFFIYKGIRFSHNLDPKTGKPVAGIKSVSVVSPSAELSDALATAVFVMGPDAGLHLLDQLPHTHGIVVDEKNTIFTSRKLDIKENRPK